MYKDINNTSEYSVQDIILYGGSTLFGLYIFYVVYSNFFRKKDEIESLIEKIKNKASAIKKIKNSESVGSEQTQEIEKNIQEIAYLFYSWGNNKHLKDKPVYIGSSKAKEYQEIISKENNEKLCFFNPEVANVTGWEDETNTMLYLSRPEISKVNAAYIQGAIDRGRKFIFLGLLSAYLFKLTKNKASDTLKEISLLLSNDYTPSAFDQLESYYFIDDFISSIVSDISLIKNISNGDDNFIKNIGGWAIYSQTMTKIIQDEFELGTFDAHYKKEQANKRLEFKTDSKNIVTKQEGYAFNFHANEDVYNIVTEKCKSIITIGKVQQQMIYQCVSTLIKQPDLAKKFNRQMIKIKNVNEYAEQDVFKKQLNTDVNLKFEYE